MDLFPVQRYLGKEDESKEDNNIRVDKMNKLLSKIKERSKLKESNKTPVSSENVTETTLSLHENANIEESNVKKKKRKYDSFTDEVQASLLQKSSISNDCKSNSLLKDIGKLRVNDNVENTEENNTADDDAHVFDGENCMDTTEKEVFPVIGDYKFKKKHKVRRVLPDWLANPSVVSVDLKHLDVSISDVPDLHSIFISNLKNNNISHFFPVQAQVIPWLLSCRKQLSFFSPCDVCVSAPTGSGKTLAYVIPILQALMGNRIGQIQALVVLPVQDLAAQVAAVFRTYSTGTGLKVHLSTGALPLPDDRSQLLRQRLGVGWESLVDILVITPGRLVEHLYSTSGFSLKKLQYIVVDEADRVIDNMQNNWLYHLDQHLSIQGCPLLTLNSLKTLPRRPQKLMFSATLSIDPEKLNQLNLFQPRLFTSVVEATKDKGAEGEFIGKFTTPAELEERVVHCILAIKPLVLFHLITHNSWTRVLVFTSSSRSVHQLCSLLTLMSLKTQVTLAVAEISAECSSEKRKMVLTDFAAGKVDVLVSTDALARGMDIPSVSYVVSYDMPKYVKAYVHRVGRTGRAGQHGVAVTMVQQSQVGLFSQMLQTAGKQETVKVMPVDGEKLSALEEVFKDALKELRRVTKGEETKKLHKTKSLKRVTSIKSFPNKRKMKRDAGSTKKKIKQEHCIQ